MDIVFKVRNSRSKYVSIEELKKEVRTLKSMADEQKEWQIQQEI